MGSASINKGLIIAFLALGGCQHQKPAEDEQMLRVAERMETSGNKTDAIHVYQELLAKADHKFPLYIKMSDSLIQTGNVKGAQTVLEEALVYDEKNQLKLRLAKCHLLQGSVDKASMIYQQILQSDPRDSECHNGLGLASTLKGADDAAIASYRTALSIDPNNKEYQSNLGLALALKKDYAKSIELLSPLGTAPKASQKQRHNLAFAYALSGDELKARSIFAQDLTPDKIEANLQTIRFIRDNSSLGQQLHPHKGAEKG